MVDPAVKVVSRCGSATWGHADCEIFGYSFEVASHRSSALVYCAPVAAKPPQHKGHIKGGVGARSGGDYLVVLESGDGGRSGHVSKIVVRT